MSQKNNNVISLFADLQEGQVALPSFVVQRGQGLCVDLSQLLSTTDFLDFVNRVFSLGLYFQGLNYLKFHALLYDDPAASPPLAEGDDFLACGIAVFRPERQALYNALRVRGAEADYVFQPLFRDADDGREDTGEVDETFPEVREEVRVLLDVDEFIASAWTNDVRFGLDLAAIHEGIAAEKAVRLVVARPKPFVVGKDAELQELAPGLRRNNAPRHLLGNRVDLRTFETRYPQVAAGLRLVKKIHRALGIDGRDIAGAPLLAPLPKDFDLAGMAGPGTSIIHQQDGDYLVASASGFLNIDTRTNQFSVSEKIVSHEGVSVKTTGDLSLSGEIYEQHGEIQEKRLVNCRSITAHGAVFGRIVSAGGLVCLKNNLVGGSATNEDGDIVIEGLASGATVVAHEGRVTLRRADNCLILAREVVVEHALNCDIVGDEVRVELSEGCALAGKSISVRIAKSRREVENVFLLRLPDLSRYEAQLAAMTTKQDKLRVSIKDLRARSSVLRNEKNVANYLTLAGKLRRREMELKPEQDVGWRRLSAQVAPTLRVLSALRDSVKQAEDELTELALRIAEVDAARAAACNGIFCTVDTITDDLRISTVRVTHADTQLAALSPKELKARLRRTDSSTELLFAGSGQGFVWTYRPSSS
ncbi:MAG TPA: FapA family protein [Accumulibacter sp.]|jgi:hypothetical protein|nr:FapA family protein [Accumulibacter sp.]HQC80677.1 FapA family protein [Accumulibacter sp.]